MLLLPAMLVAQLWKSRSRPLAVPHRKPELFGPGIITGWSNTVGSNPTHGRGQAAPPTVAAAPVEHRGASERRDSQRDHTGRPPQRPERYEQASS